MFNLNKKYIKVNEYPKLKFIPFHQIINLNEKKEPYIKTVKINESMEINFFKIKGEIYAIKPTEKTKHISKHLATKILNPVTSRSAEGSITGNCAKGIKKEFITYCQKLTLSGLNNYEIFTHVCLNIDKLK